MGEKLITFVFVLESCKCIINVSITHKRFVDSFEKQSFVLADQNVSKRWAKRRTHSNAIYLPVHYSVLLKLNSTEEVAVCISSTKAARGKGGGVSSPIYGASAQISMVSASGALVERLQTS